MNYYNEYDAGAAAWLRELINQNLIPYGHVDTRSITEVKPDDLKGYTQCHFFAGIGGWSYALQLAGWPADRPVWTGSCPCQPFSVAGRGKGVEDERHLWPVFAELIRACKPPTVFGEQVASKAGRDWLAGVFADLEGMAYQRAGADLCAAGVGAPHIRQRLFWVADSESIGGRQGEPDTRGGVERSYAKQRPIFVRGFAFGRLADSNNKGLEERQEQSAREERQTVERSGDAGGMADSVGVRCNERRKPERIEVQGECSIGAGEYTRSEYFGKLPRGIEGLGNCPSFWAGTNIQCRDGKNRRIPSEPALFPLADGLPGRVGLLRGAGNAIVPQVAAEFIAAFLDCQEAQPEQTEEWA